MTGQLVGAISHVQEVSWDLDLEFGFQVLATNQGVDKSQGINEFWYCDKKMATEVAKVLSINYHEVVVFAVVKHRKDPSENGLRDVILEYFGETDIANNAAAELENEELLTVEEVLAQAGIEPVKGADSEE